MGVGKSTVGPLVAEALHLPFVDLDDAIAATAGQSCSALLRTHGEPAFRRWEVEALQRVLAAGPVCLALGGGTVHNDRARPLLAQVRVVVLSAPLETLRPRLASSDRPLAQQAEALFAARAPGYRDAGPQVDVMGCSPDEVAARVLAALETP